MANSKAARPIVAKAKSRAPLRLTQKAVPVNVKVVNAATTPVPVDTVPEAPSRWATVIRFFAPAGEGYWVLSSPRPAVVEWVSGKCSGPGLLTIMWKPGLDLPPFTKVEGTMPDEGWVGALVRIPVPADGIVPPTRVDVPWDLIRYPGPGSPQKRLLEVRFKASGAGGEAALSLSGRFTD